MNNQLPKPTSLPDLGGLEDRKVKKLYNAQRSIRALCFLWGLGVGLLLLGLVIGLIASSNKGGEPDYILMLVLGALIALNTATIVGVMKRASWGRALGIITCVLALPGFPFGTIIGILGLFAFIGAPELFGPNRYQPEELIAEYKKRRKS